MPSNLWRNRWRVPVSMRTPHIKFRFWGRVESSMVEQVFDSIFWFVNSMLWIFLALHVTEKRFFEFSWPYNTANTAVGVLVQITLNWANVLRSLATSLVQQLKTADATARQNVMMKRVASLVLASTQLQTRMSAFASPNAYAVLNSICLPALDLLQKPFARIWSETMGLQFVSSSKKFVLNIVLLRPLHWILVSQWSHPKCGRK